VGECDRGGGSLRTASCACRETLPSRKQMRLRHAGAHVFPPRPHNALLPRVSPSPAAPSVLRQALAWGADTSHYMGIDISSLGQARPIVSRFHLCL